MKRFSLFLMIVLLVSAVFVSCSAEPANDSGATVAVSISSSKALSATPHVENLPDESTLFWYYTATKVGSGFTTGQTSGLTPIQTDANGNAVVGLPGVIGYAGTAGSGTWFSSGNWIFKFYAFKTAAAASTDTAVDTAVYTDDTESGVAVTVTPVENSDIGGSASITLKLKNDPRADSKVYIGKYGDDSNTLTTQNSIYVDFDNAYSGTASDYKLKIYVDGVQVLTSETITGTHDSNNNTGRVAFKTDSVLATYGGNDLGGLHLIEFKVFKGAEVDPYASGSVGIWARKGYTWYIAGDLDSLESVAQVSISVTNTNAFPASQEPTTIEISSESELRALAAFVNSGNNCEGMTIKLTDDIDLDGDWIPIGNSARKTADKYFAGTFNGQYYTISGLKLSEETKNLMYDENQTDSSADGMYFNEYIFGLFGVVKNATIMNLTLEDVDIRSLNRVIDSTHKLTGENVGALIGYSNGSLAVANVTVSSGSIAGSNVAGIIGRAYGAANGSISILNCTNNAKITATNGSGNKAKAAGIVGYVSGLGATVVIGECSNTGALSSTAERNAIAAGIANYGFNDSVIDNYTVRNNTNSGTITLSDNGPLYAKISAECNDGIDSNDSITASGNAFDGQYVKVGGDNVTDATPLVRSLQNGAEV